MLYNAGKPGRGGGRGGEGVLPPIRTKAEAYDIKGQALTPKATAAIPKTNKDRRAAGRR